MTAGRGWRSIAVGASCGMRSLGAPAVVRWRARDPLRLPFAALALGELVVDKLPGCPPRTIPPALAFRAAAGGYTGAAVADGRERAGGAIVGALAAVASAYGAMGARALVCRLSHIPDPLVALLEDAAAIALAVTASAR